MRWLLLYFIFFLLFFSYRRIIVKQCLRRGGTGVEAQRRSRQFSLLFYVFAGGLALTGLGFKVGLIGGLMALAGVILLSGALVMGLMKLRNWFS